MTYLGKLVELTAANADIQIFLLPVEGYFKVQTYFIIDNCSKHGIVIDPGAEGKHILEIIRQMGWEIELILLTHGHFDHMGAAETLRKELNIAIKAHKMSEDYLSNPTLNLSAIFSDPIVVENVDSLEEGQIISLAISSQLQLEVLYTPGHSYDSITYLEPKNQVAFVGDLIYNNQAGLTHFPGGNASHLQQTIREQIATLPPETILYSGHSAPLTVANLRLNMGL